MKRFEVSVMVPRKFTIEAFSMDDAVLIAHSQVSGIPRGGNPYVEGASHAFREKKVPNLPVSAYKWLTPRAYILNIQEIECKEESQTS